jgi:hypothetical protein
MTLKLKYGCADSATRIIENILFSERINLQGHRAQISAH